MILDLIIIGVILLLVIIGVVKGIARTLLNLMCVAVSAVISYLAAGCISNFIYTSFISPAIAGRVSESVSASADSAGAIAREAINGLPDFAVNIFNAFGITTDNLSKSAQNTAGSVGSNVGQAVDAALKPAITSILNVVLIVVLFLLFFIICKIISKKLEGLFHFPIIGFVNRLFGGALGFCEGAVLCYIGILVCKIALSLSSEPFLSPELISQSIIFGTIYNSEFLNSIADIINMGNNAIDTVKEIASTGASEIESAVN